MHLNVEFKAHCPHPDKVRRILNERGADYRGRDHQVDIYFNVPTGRLKLRKGTIENALIGYERDDYRGAKQSHVQLVKIVPDSGLEELLTKRLGVKVIVDKRRDIYFIENVKFHVDEVVGLSGAFLEVEAIDQDGSIGVARLTQQCRDYRELLGVREEDLLSVSYSDLLSNNTVLDQ